MTRRTWSRWLTALGVGGPMAWGIARYVHHESPLNIETWLLVSVGLVSAARGLYLLVNYFRALDALVRQLALERAISGGETLDASLEWARVCREGAARRRASLERFTT